MPIPKREMLLKHVEIVQNHNSLLDQMFGAEASIKALEEKLKAFIKKLTHFKSDTFLIHDQFHEKFKRQFDELQLRFSEVEERLTSCSIMHPLQRLGDYSLFEQPSKDLLLQSSISPRQGKDGARNSQISTYFFE